MADHPQLLSTSRHITQGLIDVEQEQWDSAKRTLGGVSRVVGGAPYELRIALPPSGSWKPATVSAEGGTIRVTEQTERGIRVVIDAKRTGKVSWGVAF